MGRNYDLTNGVLQVRIRHPNLRPHFDITLFEPCGKSTVVHSDFPLSDVSLKAREEMNQYAYKLGKVYNCPVIPYKACKDCQGEVEPFKWKLSDWCLLHHYRGETRRSQEGELCWDCFDKRLREITEVPLQLTLDYFVPGQKGLEELFQKWTSQSLGGSPCSILEGE